MDGGPHSIVLSFSEHSPVDRERLVALVNDNSLKYRFLSQAKLQIRVGALTAVADLNEIKTAVQALELSLNDTGTQ